MNTRRLTRAGLLMGLSLAIQALRLGQWFTGPVINAILFLSPRLAGMPHAVTVALLTPWGGLFLGILNPALGAAVPFIMAGNVALVIIYGILQKHISILAVLPAAAAKYVIISSGARHVLGLGPPLSLALGIPQLLTALAGGAVAWCVSLALGALRREGRRTLLDD